MRTVITLPDQIHSKAKARAAEQGISFTEWIKRLCERELESTQPQASINDVSGMFQSPEPFSMADNGRDLIEEAIEWDLAGRTERD